MRHWSGVRTSVACSGPRDRRRPENPCLEGAGRVLVGARISISRPNQNTPLAKSNELEIVPDLSLQHSLVKNDGYGITG